ncbi:MAG: hypothetical protein IPP04_17505 [Saprospiraceae bacterium]|nr:hypothetical protein [Saprospiraceae bacterium]
MERKISTATMITRFASLYNASALIIFLVPGALTLFGVEEPYSSFWQVLPALLASFGSVTLWISSNNIVQFATFPVWNGIIRIIFATVAITAGYHNTMGLFILLLALGDLLIGILTVSLVKRATTKSLLQILKNN